MIPDIRVIMPSPTVMRLWCAQVFGIGEIGDPVDLNFDNLTPDLIGRRARAFGGG